MNEHTAIVEPTSIATTSQTEPGVVAGISSAEGSPDQALSIRVPGDIGIGRMLVMLSAGLMFWIVYGIERDDWPILLTNGVSLLLWISLLWLKLREPRERAG